MASLRDERPSGSVNTHPLVTAAPDMFIETLALSELEDGWIDSTFVDHAHSIGLAKT